MALSCLALRAQDVLWYDTPAESWLQALPLGNSHMGAMVFGGAAYYWDLLDRGESLSQNIDRLFFAKNGDLVLSFRYSHPTRLIGYLFTCFFIAALEFSTFFDYITMMPVIRAWITGIMTFSF